MLPVPANAPAPERATTPSAGELLAAWQADQAATGRGNPASEGAARKFLGRWPVPQDWADQPLAARLMLPPSTMSLLMFLMVQGWLHPGWDWLVARKLSSFWREIDGSPLEADLARFCETAVSVGFAEIQTKRAASQSVGRLLIQTGRPLDQLTVADLDGLAAACRAREAATGQGWRHYRSALVCAHTVLFHLGVIDEPPEPAQRPDSFEARLADCHPNLRPAFVAYLERKLGTCGSKTVSSLTTRLAHFGRFLAEHDPELASLAGLRRQCHIEPYLNSVANAVSAKTGKAITVADQDRRIRAVGHMLAEITEWGWDDAPTRTLVFRTDHPRKPRPLPRYVPVDADRRLRAALEASTYRLAADALLLARAVGLRIGELLDLELDCVHEVGGHGAWLKVPLGKLDTERMVPLDDETVTLIDRITATRCTGQPLHRPAAAPSPNRPADPVPVHPPRPTALAERGPQRTGPQRQHRRDQSRHPPPATPHLRHRPRQRRRLAAGAHGPPRPRLSRDEPALRAPLRLHRPRRIRTRPRPGQGPHRRHLRALPQLPHQRIDTKALLADAQTRGWIDEADRHRRLLDRLDTLIADTA